MRAVFTFVALILCIYAEAEACSLSLEKKTAGASSAYIPGTVVTVSAKQIDAFRLAGCNVSYKAMDLNDRIALEKAAFEKKIAKLKTDKASLKR